MLPLLRILIVEDATVRNGGGCWCCGGGDGGSGGGGGEALSKGRGGVAAWVGEEPSVL